MRSQLSSFQRALLILALCAANLGLYLLLYRVFVSPKHNCPAVEKVGSMNSSHAGSRGASSREHPVPDRCEEPTEPAPGVQTPRSALTSGRPASHPRPRSALRVPHQELRFSRDAFAREMALEVLAAEAGEEHIAAVRERLFRDEDLIVRARAAALLALHAPGFAATDLLEAARSDPATSVRAAAIAALVELRDSRAFRALEVLAADRTLPEDLRLIAAIAVEERANPALLVAAP